MNKKTRVPIKDCKRDALPEQPFNAYIRETGEGMEHFNLLMEGVRFVLSSNDYYMNSNQIVILEVIIFYN